VTSTLNPTAPTGGTATTGPVALTGRVQGRADGRLGGIVARLEAALENDPEYSFQAAAFAGGQCVLDVWGGSTLSGDSLIVPFSVTKNIIGFSIALLLDRGQLDLDERVAQYWPEFAAHGKQHVTVRMLL
jgi:CubicO group peptidase (beta-lactamase class C family)